jgi:hypothetical protein
MEGLVIWTGLYSETGLCRAKAPRGVTGFESETGLWEGDWACTVRLGSNRETGLEPRGRKERK